MEARMLRDSLPRYVLALLCAVATLPTLQAQTVDEEPYELPDQVITAVLLEEPVSVVASTTIVTAEDLATSNTSSIAAALENIPGVTLSPTGTGSSETTVSLRGSTANQVLVIVDGVPVTDTATGRTDLSRLQIAVESIESIKVIRGSLSAHYGADAVGGVVVITTKKGATESGYSISVTNKSFLPASSTVGSGAHAAQNSPDPRSLIDGQGLSFSTNLGAAARLSVSAERASNSFYYYDRNYVRRQRQNADSSQAKASLSWKGDAGGGELASTVSASVRALGVPGSLDMPTPEARQNDFDASASTEYNTDYFFSDRLAFKATGYGKFGSLSYRETSGAQSDVHKSAKLGGDASWSILAGDKTTVDTGISFRYDRLNSTVVTTGAGKSPDRYSVGAFVDPQFNLKGWLLTPSLRWDWASDFAPGVSAALGAAKKLSDTLSLSGSLSTAYRAPSFDDLYWPPSGGAEGNSSLKPETAYEADAGLSWQRNDTALSASAYARYVHDVILWQENDDGIWRPTNFGDALYPGLEVEAKTRIEPWQFSISYSFLYSFVLSGNLKLADDKRVPYVPIHSLDALVSYSAGSFGASFDFSYKGLRYLTTDNKAYLPSAFLAGASLRWKLSRSLSLKIEGNNLFNERYESIQGYPTPGFSLSTSLSYKPASRQISKPAAK